MKVFICAAGKGSRLEKITNGKPKPLLRIGKYSLLEYLLLMFSKNYNVEQIHLIVGYQKDFFITKFGQVFNNIPLFYHINDDYEKSNNLYSLYCARHAIRGDIIFSTADLVIDPHLVELFLSEKKGNRVLVDSKLPHTNLDVVKVKIENGIVTEMSKNLPLEKFCGSAAGLYRMSQKGSEAYFQSTEKIIQESGKNVGFIAPIPYLKNTEPFYASNYNDYLWFDVDNEEDFNRAQKIIPELYSQFQI